MHRPRQRIEMRRYAIVNAVMATAAALVLLLHEDPGAIAPRKVRVADGPSAPGIQPAPLRQPVRTLADPVQPAGQRAGALRRIRRFTKTIFYRGSES